MQLKKTSKKIGSLINEVRTFSNGYFSFNNIDVLNPIYDLLVSASFESLFVLEKMYLFSRKPMNSTNKHKM